ncbi:MAG: N-acetylmuramoyl-L-alanine amidase [Clostridiales bacterium]|nr:N-acetylmuramoyl-L-alanine amidase [Clostridiales bacterium]
MRRMKKIIVLILMATLAIGMLSGCTFPWMSADLDPEITSTEQEISTESEPETEVASEVEGEISDTEMAQEVESTEEETEAEPTPADYNLRELEKVYAIRRVNVRTEPSTDSDVYEVLAKNQSVRRLEDDGEWSKVIIDDQFFYVSSDYLTTEPPEGSNGFVVVIDAGDQQEENTDKEPVGPNAKKKTEKASAGETGAMSGLDEYDLNLTIAKKLQKILEDRGYEVVMCRTENNVDISGSERAQIANNAIADAFISIHANFSDDTTDNGVVTICQTADNPYTDGLYDQSRALAEDLLDCFSEATGAEKQDVQESDEMSVINWAELPTAIIEVGYLSNPSEDLSMSSDNYQSLMAEGIANGIDLFLLGEAEEEE